MSNNQLTESELAVLESLQDSNMTISQRELAKRTGMSVGLINAVIKKLVHTGYVKTSHLNRKSINYLLTPDGFSQAALKSYHYMADTVRNYRSIQVKIRALLSKLLSEGVTDFYLCGDGELAELVAVTFEGEGRAIGRVLPEKAIDSAVILNAGPEALKKPSLRVIDLVKVLHA